MDNHYDFIPLASLLSTRLTFLSILGPTFEIHMHTSLAQHVTSLPHIHHIMSCHYHVSTTYFHIITKSLPCHSHVTYTSLSHHHFIMLVLSSILQDFIPHQDFSLLHLTQSQPLIYQLILAIGSSILLASNIPFGLLDLLNQAISTKIILAPQSKLKSTNYQTPDHILGLFSIIKSCSPNQVPCVLIKWDYYDILFLLGLPSAHQNSNLYQIIGSSHHDIQFSFFPGLRIPFDFCTSIDLFLLGSQYLKEPFSQTLKHVLWEHM